MDWDDLRHFLALARNGSVRAAGAALRVSHTTVARRVESLEAELGTRLFDRHRDGYVLTDAGARLLPAAERVEDGITTLARAMVGGDRALRGPVHVTCGDPFVAAQVIEDLAPWCAEHPDVELRVDHDGRPFNLAKGEADLAIRALGVGHSPPETLVAKHLARIVVANYGAPGGSCARWLGAPDPRVVEAIRSGGAYAELPAWGSFGSVTLIVAAASAGLGYAILPTYMGDVSPGLVRLPTADVRHLGELWLLSHPDLRETARVQAARRLILEGFVRRRALYEG